jgi:hypothetical protein
MRYTICPLILAVASLLIAAPTPAAANPPYRVRYAPAPAYVPVHPAYPVYVFPQVTSTPSYYYGYPYSSDWYGGYSYTPSYYGYSYSPFGGYNSYYANPSFYFWYSAR